jgi:hypothetical protein
MSTNESSTYAPDIPASPVTKITDTIHIELTPDDLDSLAASRFVRSPSAGATVIFIGTTRDSFDNKPVSSLAYTSYAPLAISTLFKVGTGAFHLFLTLALYTHIVVRNTAKALLHENRNHPQTRRVSHWRGEHRDCGQCAASQGRVVGGRGGAGDDEGSRRDLEVGEI